MTTEELIEKVKQWGLDRNIIGPNAKATPMSQVIKTTEEVQELLKAVFEGDRTEMKDGIGDTMVTLILLCELTGETIFDCLEHAFNEIKDRKGSMQNGTFVKEA